MSATADYLLKHLTQWPIAYKVRRAAEELNTTLILYTDRAPAFSDGMLLFQTAECLKIKPNKSMDLL